MESVTEITENGMKRLRFTPFRSFSVRAVFSVVN